MRKLKASARAAVVLALAAGAVGCGQASSPSGAGPMRVVAAENFYGDLARLVGGQSVTVTSVLANPDADPHLFEPGSRTGLAVAQASVVIQNGVGYDDWMGKLLAAAPSSRRKVVTIADALHVVGSNPNPHLWYDTPALPTVVTAMGDAFQAADPEHAAAYREGMQRTIASLQPLENAVQQMRQQHAGASVAYTERVPGLLLSAAGLRVRTPATFARSIEDGTDPSPSDVAAMESLLRQRSVKVLLYNEQATSAITVRLRTLARLSGVPVVAVTETVPPGVSFLDWQLAQVRALAAALNA
jgi:zinc/manganese transport system substrate-binding protein